MRVIIPIPFRLDKNVLACQFENPDHVDPRFVEMLEKARRAAQRLGRYIR